VDSAHPFRARTVQSTRVFERLAGQGDAVHPCAPPLAGTPVVMAHHREARSHLSAVADVHVGCVQSFLCSGASAWPHGATFM